MTIYRHLGSGTRSESLERIRGWAIKEGERYIKGGLAPDRTTREYIVIMEKKSVKGSVGLVQKKTAGYVSIKNGHYIWVTGKSRKDYRVLDKSGRVMRKLTKNDYDYIV